MTKEKKTKTPEAPESTEKPVKLELSHHDARVLRILLDHAVKSGGIPVAQAALWFDRELASQEPKEEKEDENSESSNQKEDGEDQE